MKPFQAVMFLTLMITVSCRTFAMSIPPRDHDIMLQGHLNTRCIPHNGGTVYVQMQLTTRGNPRPERASRPMNISVVLDRSGSMADERKIDYAKQAVTALIDRLSTNDYLSIVIYDDRIETLVPTQRVKDKSYIKRCVQEVYPRGSTNLGGGMVEGFRQIEGNFRSEYVNRVILLSDGLANQGITEPYELNRIVSRYRSQSISLSTIGVGLDYNENLMLGLAEHGGGSYYFVESPAQLASIFEKELNGMSNVVVQNASIELSLGSGVTLNDIIGCERRNENDRWIIPVGDLYGNDHREFTIELHIPEGTGTKQVASGILRVHGENRLRGRLPGFSVDIHYSDDAAELIKGKDWDTQGKVDIAVSTKGVQDAMEALDAGRQADAEAKLKEASVMLQSSQSLSNSPAAAPLIQEQIRQLEVYSKDLKDERADKRRVKKSIQYDNYRTQKKK